jgi:hypothetical protein
MDALNNELVVTLHHSKWIKDQISAKYKRISLEEGVGGEPIHHF